jgi:hypothetical protein
MRKFDLGTSSVVTGALSLLVAGGLTGVFVWARDIEQRLIVVEQRLNAECTNTAAALKDLHDQIRELRATAAREAVMRSRADGQLVDLAKSKGAKAK